MPPLSAPLLSPKHTEITKSLGARMASPAATLPIIFNLTWDYPPAELTNVQFEVWHTLSITNSAVPLTRFDQVPAGFTMLILVDAPPLVIGGLAAEFFIVRARSRFDSALVSGWNK